MATFCQQIFDEAQHRSDTDTTLPTVLHHFELHTEQLPQPQVEKLCDANNNVFVDYFDYFDHWSVDIWWVWFGGEM